MIKIKVAKKFPHHVIEKYSDSIYVVDETGNKNNSKEVFITKSHGVYKGLYIDNTLDIGVSIHNNESFIDAVGKSLSHCECTAFPYIANDDSWVLFVELKYCKYTNKTSFDNLPKAKQQLLATYSYYKREGIIGNKAISYLIVGFPKIDKLPFRNSTITQCEAQQLKRKENIVMAISNQCKIISNRIIRIV